MAGVLWKDSEKTVWQDRRTNGFTRPTNMPDTDALSSARADYFINNPGTDYVTTSAYTSELSPIGEFLLSAAWEYLLTDNTTYGNAVHDHVVNQVAEPNVDYSTFGTLGTGSDNASFNAAWVIKLYKAFDYTRDLYTAGELSDIQTWFYNAGLYFQRTMNESIFIGRFKYRSEFARYDTTAALVAAQSGHFIGRKYWVKESNLYYELIGSKTGNLSDYSTSTTAWRNHWPDITYVSQAAMLADQGNQVAGKLYDYNGISPGYAYLYNGVATGSTGDYTYGNYQGSGVFNPTPTTRYTHRDFSGTQQNLIYPYMNFYKNTMAVMAYCIACCGFELDDNVMKDHAKLFVEEFLMYATFPDGTMAEYIRNGDYGVPQQGSGFYGVVCFGALVFIADLFWRYDDASVYEYSTSLGLHGTEGGTKNIKKILSTVVEHCTATHGSATVERRYLDSGVSEANLLDTYNVANNTRYLPDVELARASNYFYNVEVYTDLKNAYLNITSGSIGFDPSFLYPIGAAGHSFGNGFGLEADIPTGMFQNEDLFIVETTTIKAGIRSILVT